MKPINLSGSFHRHLKHVETWLIIAAEQLLPSRVWMEFVIVFALLLFSLLQILLVMPAGVLQTLKTFFKNAERKLIIINK